MRDTAGEARKNLLVTFFYRPPPVDLSMLTDQQELIYISSVQAQYVVKRGCWERWMIGTSWERERERESEKFMQSAWFHDDEDDDDDDDDEKEKDKEEYSI